MNDRVRQAGVRTGADDLVAAASAAGVEVCFTNPGTTELDIVTALDNTDAVHPVLALFEGVAAGAADGYGRVARKPAMTMFHLGGGLGNAVANLHNARRARTPILNEVGEHATWHAIYDSALASDIRSLAEPVSTWVRTASATANLGRDVLDAVDAATRPPGGVATLIVPADCQWNESTGKALPPRSRMLVALADDSAVAAAVAALAHGPGAVLLIGGDTLSAEGLRLASRLQHHLSCRVVVETFAARLERGAHLPAFRPLPYFPDAAVKTLANASAVITVGTTEPLTTFATRTTPVHPTPCSATHVPLAPPGFDPLDALARVVEATGAPEVSQTRREPVVAPSGLNLDALAVAEAVAAHLVEGSIVVDESATSGAAIGARLPYASGHLALALTGGAIGMGMPAGLGAAIAAPDRRVVVLQADGSGMYTPQALWSMAREGANVTVVVFANRRYEILRLHMAKTGQERLGPHAAALTDLADPALDWVSLARGMGVPASSSTTADEFSTELAKSLATDGPHLIEAVLA